MGIPSQTVDGQRSAATVRRVNDRLMFVIMAGLLFVVGFVSLATQTDTVVTAPAPLGGLVTNKLLQFVDDSEGSVVAIDGPSGEVVTRFPSGEGSFVRGVLRSLVRARNAQGLPQAATFNLALYSDGRLILSDPDTTQSIDLVAFGATNFQSFSQLLEDE